ncbi:hypothetical protein CORC01_07469 [Colletotrichum orchidophilum]|uniref:Uncharacterized protein n=1 Tax=Colletotrichum orchidophilum TaxID=1209926 RepID=A0A1G4B7H0_9PEZI|nr:uncharacterized protein CORC01_07469 [Colletotrichum orchidophilum]OHE97215.1 hypothetical protein CORC01_07469 [Colletotrichum orchidophilum]
MDRSQLTKQPPKALPPRGGRFEKKKNSARSVCRVGSRGQEGGGARRRGVGNTERHRNTVCEASECQPGLFLTWRDRSQLPTPPALRRTWVGSGHCISERPGRGCGSEGVSLTLFSPE